MKKKKVTIIDYGAGNILSIQRAFEECKADVKIATKAKEIDQASCLVLPGDGSFSYASKKLKKYDFFEKILKHVNKGNPLFGICLGMQMLLTKSEEFGLNKGLSIINGKIIKIKKQKKPHLKVPVIGWHDLYGNLDKKKITFNIGNIDKKKFYFVHSYKAVTNVKKESLAHYNYGTEKITAIIGKENVIGTQFHPEKSGLNGLKLIAKILKT